jgi:hypothetical protein
MVALVVNQQFDRALHQVRSPKWIAGTAQPRLQIDHDR